jgi:hypothetical protein
MGALIVGMTPIPINTFWTCEAETPAASENERTVQGSSNSIFSLRGAAVLVPLRVNVRRRRICNESSSGPPVPVRDLAFVLRAF